MILKTLLFITIYGIISMFDLSYKNSETFTLFHYFFIYTLSHLNILKC